MKLIDKLFGFFGIKRAEMVNGELGMALFEDNNIFWGLIEKLQKGTV